MLLNRPHAVRKLGLIGRHWLPYLAFAAVGLGVGLRVDGLDRKSLWGDEVLTIWRVSRATTSETLENLKDSPFPPLYYLILRGWSKIAGLNDVTVRLPALGFGLVTLPITYLLWRPLLGRRASLWALSLMSLNSFHIWYSNDAKMYSLVWALATISSASFLRVILGPQGWSPWLIVYAAASGCLPLISYVGAAPLAVQFIYGLGLAWVRPDCRPALIRAGCVGIAALLPFALWLPEAFKAATERRGIQWIPPAAWQQAPADLYRLLGTFLLGYNMADGPSPRGAWWTALAIVYAPCIIVSSYVLARSLMDSLHVGFDTEWVRTAEVGNRGFKNCSAPVVVYLAMWLLLPVFEMLFFSLTIYSLWGVPRYLAAAAPALTLWLAVSLGSRPGGSIRPALGMLLVAGNILIIAFDRAQVARIPWRDYAWSIGTTVTATECFRLPILADPTPGSEATRSVRVVRMEDNIHVLSLQYALRRLSPPIEMVDSYLRVAASEKNLFFVLHRYPARPRSGGILKGPEAVAGFTCRRVRRDVVYEDRFSAAPSPFMPFTVELWAYIPEGHSGRNRP